MREIIGDNLHTGMALSFILIGVIEILFNGTLKEGIFYLAIAVALILVRIFLNGDKEVKK